MVNRPMTATGLAEDLEVAIDAESGTCKLHRKFDLGDVTWFAEADSHVWRGAPRARGARRFRSRGGSLSAPHPGAPPTPFSAADGGVI